MKTLIPFTTGILISTILPFTAAAQCAGGLLPFTIRYDTTVIGNGNTSRSFSFPKFNPALGTLLSADLKSVVNLAYSYTLENQDNAAHVYRTKIIRTDDIYSTALDPSSVSAVNQTPFVVSSIGAGQHVDYGPAHMNYTVNNSVTDGRLINFMGAGTVDFDYETGTSASVMGPLPYGLNFASATDTTVFSVTYRYCAASLLSSDLLFFTALPKSNNRVALNWRQTSVDANRNYDVQVSLDGTTFITIATLIENSKGVYDYTYMGSTAKKLYFRIQEKNISGEIKYSNIRLVIFEQEIKGTARIFPTLYTGGNLQVNFAEKGDWQINVFAADGRTVLKNRQEDTYNASFALPNGLGNGVYIVQTIYVLSGQIQNTRIIIQR